MVGIQNMKSKLFVDFIRIWGVAAADFKSIEELAALAPLAPTEVPTKGAMGAQTESDDFEETWILNDDSKHGILQRQ